MDIKPIGSYPLVYDSKILNPITHTATGGETRIFESVKQGGKRSGNQGNKKKSRRLRKSNKRKNRKTCYKK